MAGHSFVKKEDKDMYKIVLPQIETVYLSQLEQRLYRASMLDVYGYDIVHKSKYTWEVITPDGKKYVVKYKDGKLNCDCPDAKFRAKIYADGWCKHKLFVLTKTDLDDVVAVSLLTYPWLTKYLKKLDEGG
jgi:hypothetical protein